jgi:cobalt-zinc-cadmium efflux system membrane fusion protein
MRISVTLLVAALCAQTACRKAADEEKKSDADSTAMADIPEMKTGGGLAADIMLTDEQVKHGKIAWGPATMGTAPSVAMLPGTLTPNEDRTARLGAPAGGRVLDVRVQPGDKVRAGQLLATIQSRDASMAQSDVIKAAAEVTSCRAQARYSAASRARAERLLALKAIPQQDYDRAIVDDESAKAALAQAEAEHQRAMDAAAQMGASASASGEIAIRSPRAGVVLSREAVPGTVIESGAPVVAITDPSALWLRVNAPEQYASSFRPGGALRFSISAAPGESFTARIEAVSPGLDPETRTLGVRAAVSAGTRLKSEMLATVEVASGPKVSAVLLPEDAVQSLKGMPTVFVAMPMGKRGIMMTRREVQVGSRAGGRIAVLGGLKAGELVVTSGAFAVRAQFEKGLMPKMEM